MSTDMTARVPFETEKASELHDQEQMPAQPDDWKRDFRMYLGWPLLGVILAAGGAALVFEIRQAWDSHRDWVPPAAITGTSPAALAMAYLLWRRRLVELSPGLAFLVATLAFTFIGVALEQGDGSTAAKNTMTILAAVSLALTCVSFLAAFIWTEWKSPSRAPDPEA